MYTSQRNYIDLFDIILTILIPVIVLLAIYGNLNNLPLANDSWRYVFDPFVKMRNVGRWSNFIFFDYKHIISPAFGLLLDGITHSFILTLLIKKSTIEFDIVTKLSLYFLWCSSSPIIMFYGYPGAIAVANTIVCFSLYLLMTFENILIRLFIYLLSGITLFSAYETHYFLIFLVYPLSKTVVHYDLKSVSREFIFWVLGFILGFISWQLFHYILYDKFILPPQSYRTLNEEGASVFQNVYGVLKAVNLGFQSNHPNFPNTYNFVIQMCLFIMLIYSSVTIVKKYVLDLIVIFLPLIGFILLLSLANHNYFPRMGLTVIGCFSVLLLKALQSKLKINYILIFCIIVLSFLTILKFGIKIDGLQKQVKMSENAIFRAVPSYLIERNDVILVYGNKIENSKNSRFNMNLAGATAYKLGVRNIWYCKNSVKGVCAKIKGKDIEESDDCDSTFKYLGKNGKYHILRIGVIRSLCKDN